MNYIVIFSKEIKNKQNNILIDFLKGLLGDVSITQTNEYLLIENTYQEVIDFNEIANVIVNDLFFNITLLETFSNNLVYVEELIKLYNKVDQGYLYLSSKMLLTFSDKSKNDIFKKEILKEFYNDFEMLNIIKVFLEHDLNTTTSAQVLYLHRNTLINKIDKFVRVTNFDVRKFTEAIIIYQLIK